MRDVGCAIIGQTAELAPADKVLYALRDVTATVDCLPLVVSSILSKKLAAGCDVVVLDVKTGSGAIMDTPQKSRQLAETMVRIGNMSGKRFSALLTDMDQPLGNYIGNALEVEEAIDVLAGRTEGELKRVALTLGAHILRNAGAAESIEAGIEMLEAKIASGEGLRTFGDMIEAQGGDRRVVEDTSLLPKAPTLIDLKADRAGYITRMVTSDIGNAAKLLGAGRERKTDELDLSVGIVMKKRVGEKVRRGDVLATLHVGPKSDRIGAYNLLKRSIVIGDDKPEVKPLRSGGIRRRAGCWRSACFTMGSSPSACGWRWARGSARCSAPGAWTPARQPGRRAGRSSSGGGMGASSPLPSAPR